MLSYEPIIQNDIQRNKFSRKKRILAVYIAECALAWVSAADATVEDLLTVLLEYLTDSSTITQYLNLCMKVFREGGTTLCIHHCF